MLLLSKIDRIEKINIVLVLFTKMIKPEHIFSNFERTRKSTGTNHGQT